MGCGHCKSKLQGIGLCVRPQVISKIDAHYGGQKVKIPSLGSVGQALKICLLMAVDRPKGIEGLSKSRLAS